MNADDANTLAANVGITLCKPLRVVCVTEKQFAEANSETHIVGLAFVRFFLIDTGRNSKYVGIVEQVENAYFSMLYHPPLRVSQIGFSFYSAFVAKLALARRRIGLRPPVHPPSGQPHSDRDDRYYERKGLYNKDTIHDQYNERKDIYYRLSENCVKFDLDPAEDLVRNTSNGPGLELHKAILWNVFSSSSGLHRPTHEELIKISYDSLHAALFSYDFLDRNWEELVMGE